jgi:hypothetical protein
MAAHRCRGLALLPWPIAIGSECHGPVAERCTVGLARWERGKPPQDPPETVEDQLVASFTRAANAASWARSTICGTWSFKDPIP